MVGAYRGLNGVLIEIVHLETKIESFLFRFALATHM